MSHAVTRTASMPATISRSMKQNVATTAALAVHQAALPDRIHAATRMREDEARMQGSVLSCTACRSR
jgi:hypothetical protein